MCCENFMVLQVKITLAVNKIQGDLVMLREKEAIVTCHLCKKGHFVVVLRGQNFRPVPIAFFLLKNLKKSFVSKSRA